MTKVFDWASGVVKFWPEFQNQLSRLEKILPEPLWKLIFQYQHSPALTKSYTTLDAKHTLLFEPIPPNTCDLPDSFLTYCMKIMPKYWQQKEEPNNPLKLMKNVTERFVLLALPDPDNDPLGLCEFWFDEYENRQRSFDHTDRVVHGCLSWCGTALRISFSRGFVRNTILFYAT